MSDPGLIAAKLAAVQATIRDYVNGIKVNYMGMNITVGDHVSDDQIEELTVLVVNSVDDTEAAWAAARAAAPMAGTSFETRSA